MPPHRSLRHAARASKPGRLAVANVVAFLAVVVIVSGAALGGVAAAVDSNDSPDHTTTTRVDPETYHDLASALLRNQHDSADLADQLDDANARLAQLESQLADVQQRLDATRAELAGLRQLVRARAAFIYANARAPETAIVDIKRTIDLSAGQQYAESATHHDLDQIADLTATADALDARRRDVAAARDAQRDDRDRLQKAKTDLDALIAKQQRLLDEAGAITVMGEPELTGTQMSEWFASRGARYRLAGGMTITELADIYVEEGAAEHVRPELAFAQAMVETGSFGNAIDNNFAGIGACDSCTSEIPFATPREGVRGQVQMLRNYADPWSRASNLANPPSAPIYGSDPWAAAASYDTFFAKGRVPTWNLMGDGNWATDPVYAPKVLSLYFQMMSFATRRA